MPTLQTVLPSARIYFAEAVVPIRGYAEIVTMRSPPRAAEQQTLTLQRLGITDALYRTLRGTNPIENLNGSVMLFARNVRRWKDASMILRWVGTALHEAQKQFRRLKFGDLADGAC